MLLIGDKSVVSFHFTLKNDKGEVIESSSGSEPLTYLHGAGNIVPGLEEALTGKSTGAKFTAVLPPEKGYGVRDDRLMQKVPKTQFPEPEKLEEGMQFQVNSPAGPMVLTITGFEGDTVVVDGNPELAGMTLTFDIEVTDVRSATEEELEHGHVHGAGGHHH